MDHVCAPVVATSEFSLLYYQRYLCISVNALAKKSRLVSPAFVLSSPSKSQCKESKVNLFRKATDTLLMFK